MGKPVHHEWLRRFRECLRAGHMDQLETWVHQAGLEVILDPELLALARQTDARQVVILIATLGVSNASNPAPYERLLAAYQHLAGQLPLQEAAQRCAATGQGSVAFYQSLLGSTGKASPSPDLSGLQFTRQGLQFGIELLADANKAPFITPLLRAWQAMERTDMPWLFACRELAARARFVQNATEAEQLALATRERLQDAPRGQEAVKQQLRLQQANMALKSRNGALALAAAEEAFAHAPGPEVRFPLAKALMMKGELPRATAQLEALVLELVKKGESLLLEDKPAPMSFDVAAAEDTLLTVNRLLRAAGLRPFLMSGTLLGYAREGALLPHDKDIDLGLLGWEDQFTVAQVLIQSGHFALDLSQLSGQKLFLMAANDLRNGMAVDFFFFHERADHFLHGIDFDVGVTQNYRFSKFGLRDVEFLGETFSIPDDVDTNLSENYGDWRTPSKSYVVTVESPALCKDQGPTRQLVAHLEILKTISQGMSPERMRRILASVDAQGLPFLSPSTRSAVETWLREQAQKSAEQVGAVMSV